MAVSLIKPSKEALAKPEDALRILMRMFEALTEMQKADGVPSPQSIAEKAGIVRIVKIAGATVTDPATGQTFTADVYAEAVKL
jgi:hypothetical protein